MIEVSQFSHEAAAPTGRIASEGRKWNPILVGTDGSEGATRAIDIAGGLAADLGAELWIAHVLDEASETDSTRLARTEGSSIGDAAEAMAR